MAEEQTQQSTRYGCGCVALIVAIFVIGGLIASAAGVGDSDDSDSLEFGAIDVCEQKVKAQLRAPATAEFTGENATAETASRYQVVGNVDAENGFGALLRMTWTCEAIHVEGNQWRVTAVVND